MQEAAEKFGSNGESTSEEMKSANVSQGFTPLNILDRTEGCE